MLQLPANVFRNGDPDPDMVQILLVILLDNDKAQH